jgi:hypothetical protein
MPTNVELQLQYQRLWHALDLLVALGVPSHRMLASAIDHLGLEPDDYTFDALIEQFDTIKDAASAAGLCRCTGISHLD